MFTNLAYLESITASEGRLALNLIFVTEFSKVPRQMVFPANVTREEINRQIQAQLDSMDLAVATSKSLQPGLLDLSVVAEPPETAEEQMRRSFAVDVLRLRQLQRGISLGLLASDDAAVQDLTVSLQKRLIQPDYLDLL